MQESLWLTLLPAALRFEMRLALRHLRSGGGQTLLTFSAVAAGVIIVVFITSLIFGLQQRWTGILTEAIPHVTVRVAEVQPTPLADVPGAAAGLTSSRLEQRIAQQRNIENWAQVVAMIRSLPNVRVAVPVVRAQAFVSKGGNPVGVSVIGADPAAQDQVTPVTKNLIAGHYLGLESEDIVIDHQLARDLRVATGDRLRLTSNTCQMDTIFILSVLKLYWGRVVP